MSATTSPLIAVRDTPPPEGALVRAVLVEEKNTLALGLRMRKAGRWWDESGTIQLILPATHYRLLAATHSTTL